jgi:hypothetical protein
MLLKHFNIYDPYTDLSALIVDRTGSQMKQAISDAHKYKTKAIPTFVCLNCSNGRCGNGI